jgi:hypothetical protein
MDYVIEQLRLTDTAGKPVRFTPPKEFHAADGNDARGVLLRFVESDGATIIGAVTEFPGSQATVTVKKGEQVYTLHAYPGGQRIPIK